MRLFFSPDQLGHRPAQYGVHGRLVKPVENPDRGETLLRSFAALGMKPERPDDAGASVLHTVHANHYVDYLRTAFERFQALPNAGPEVLPNVHPYHAWAPGLEPRPRPKSEGILGQTGWYVGDLSCAIGEDTFTAAYASAMSAAAAARTIRVGNDAGGEPDVAVALCRPPGHHAYADRATGFCFFNNAAIAAEVLRERFAKVAIIDFDTHHGDGTQAIFYDRADIFCGSTHTDPTNYYPHYFGYADEIGRGAGEGCNVNLPLTPGAGDDVFVAAVEDLSEAATAFGAQALVLSAGWDAHRDDPLSKLDVSTKAYERLGRGLASLNLPTVIVQEGGYSLAAVAEAAPAFVSSFL